MRKPFIALAAAASLTAATIPALQAQVFPPVVSRPSVPVAPAPAPIAEVAAIETLRNLLAHRGFGHEAAAGPMAALRPGQATAFLFTSDDDLDTLLRPGVQADAWLVTTQVGRWWVWEDGAAGPADRRAEAYQVLATPPNS